MNTIAHQVALHALANYTRDGWDWVVECWTVEGIQKYLDEERITTLQDAIEEFEAYVLFIHEQEQEHKPMKGYHY